MMPDLMHQHMRHDHAERVVLLRPEIEDRTPVEPDHVGELPGLHARRPLREAASAKQAEKVELRLTLHFVEGLLVGEILDADDDAVAEGAKLPRQLGEGVLRHQVELFEGRRTRARPVDGVFRSHLNLPFASFFVRIRSGPALTRALPGGGA